MPSPTGRCGLLLFARQSSRPVQQAHYGYPSLAARDGAVIATGTVHGHTRVLARGRLRHHKLRLTFKQLHRGRYRLTLIELGSHGTSRVIGRTTLVVT